METKDFFFPSFILYQPLFPGESGVDQLVEIIKVVLTFQISE